MDKNKNYLALKKSCLEAGIDLFGVADITAAKNEFVLSEKALSTLTRAVCLGLRLSRGILADIEAAPTRLYFHHYKTVNAFLDQSALRACNYIQKKGFIAVAIPASQIVDWQKQTAHLSHKKIGNFAGLGWIGRNNLLVNKELGSQFRLVTILTDMPLKIDRPAKEECGACRACVRLCPAQAIKESPAAFDHQKCFDKLKEFRDARLVDQYICGVCVKACQGRKEEI